MDFLNTSAMPGGELVEWLKDGDDLLDWLVSANAIDPVVAMQFRSEASRVQLDEVAQRARSMRAWLREFLERHAGRPLAADAATELGPLNQVLARAQSHYQIEADGETGALALTRARRWTEPAQLLHPIAEAIGELIVEADFGLIRACEGSACTLMFLDRTKSHARRWCSMALCGNRAKVAAHRARAQGKSA
ncbi:CGNR zinc finger domain-containing protein [Variovorax paradoxus]|nr:CGNR zinc finger domain-containing protein [Variovorax paradoxus]